MARGFPRLPRAGTFLNLQVLAIQLKCYKEIIDIGHAVYRVYDLPWFRLGSPVPPEAAGDGKGQWCRTLSWYLLACSNYFFFGETLIDNWAIVLRKVSFPSPPPHKAWEL